LIVRLGDLERMFLGPVSEGALWWVRGRVGGQIELDIICITVEFKTVAAYNRAKREDVYEKE